MSKANKSVNERPRLRRRVKAAPAACPTPAEGSCAVKAARPHLLKSRRLKAAALLGASSALKAVRRKVRHLDTCLDVLPAYSRDDRCRTQGTRIAVNLLLEWLRVQLAAVAEEERGLNDKLRDAAQ